MNKISPWSQAIIEVTLVLVFLFLIGCFVYAAITGWFVG